MSYKLEEICLIIDVRIRVPSEFHFSSQSLSAFVNLMIVLISNDSGGISNTTVKIYISLSK